MKIGAVTNTINIANTTFPKLPFRGESEAKQSTLNQDIFEKSEEQQVKERIVNLFEDLDGLSEQQKQEEANLIYCNLKKDKKETLYFDTLCRLVENEDFFPEFLFQSNAFSKINKCAKRDLDMIIQAEKNNQNFEKTAISTYEDEYSALESAKKGDVFEIKGQNNLRTKTKDGIKEIFLGKENYISLFYPLERYTLIQGIAGDCYMLSALDSLYSNPNSADRILECFKENENGTVSFNLGGYERKGGDIVEKDPERYTIEDFEDEFYKQDRFYYTTGAGWVKAFELGIRQETERNAHKHIAQAYEYFKKADRNNGAIEYNGYKYYKDEVELFLQYADTYLKNPDNPKSKLVCLKDLCSCLEFGQTEEGETFSIDIENKQYLKYFRAIEKRYENYMKAHNQDFFVFDAIVPMPFAQTILGLFDDDETDIQDIYTDGGAPKIIFEKLGYKTKELSKKDDIQELSKILNCKNFSSKYAVTAHSDYENYLYSKDFKVYPAHTYSIEAIDEDNERFYAVRDPHNSLYETFLTYDELMECFDCFTFCEVE